MRGLEQASITKLLRAVHLHRQAVCAALVDRVPEDKKGANATFNLAGSA